MQSNIERCIGNTKEGAIHLTTEERDALNKARDIYAAIGARSDLLRKEGCTRCYLVAGDEKAQLFGPLFDFMSPAWRASHGCAEEHAEIARSGVP